MTSVSQAGPVWHAIQFCMPPHFSSDSNSRSEDLWSAQLHLENLDTVTSFSDQRPRLLSLTWSRVPESLTFTVQVLCSYSDWKNHTTVNNSTFTSKQPGWNHTSSCQPYYGPSPLPFMPLKDHHKHFLHDWKYLNNLISPKTVRRRMRGGSLEKGQFIIKQLEIKVCLFLNMFYLGIHWWSGV